MRNQILGKTVKNRINLFRKLYSELDIFFDFDIWNLTLKQSMQHLSLFSVCLHFFFFVIEVEINCLEVVVFFVHVKDQEILKNKLLFGYSY